MKISQRVSELLNGHDFPCKIFKGALFCQNEGGSLVIVLCLLSDSALNSFQVS